MKQQASWLLSWNKGRVLMELIEPGDNEDYPGPQNQGSVIWLLCFSWPCIVCCIEHDVHPCAMVNKSFTCLADWSHPFNSSFTFHLDEAAYIKAGLMGRNRLLDKHPTMLHPRTLPFWSVHTTLMTRHNYLLQLRFTGKNSQHNIRTHTKNMWWMPSRDHKMCLYLPEAHTPL